MTDGKLIYVVEDEKDLCDSICRKLQEYQLQTRAFYLGESARQEIIQCTPDVCIIDLMLPDMDGLDLVKDLSKRPAVGVIVLTGRGDLSDRVLGLEVGADDYIVKPFEMRELVARVHSLSRRIDLLAQSFSNSQGRFARFAERTYDIGEMIVQWDNGRQETLSASEALLLLKFLTMPKRVLSRDQLLEDELDCSRQPFDRSIDTRISRLRRKIEDDPKEPRIIKTVYAAGYLMAADVAWNDHRW